MKIMPHIPTLLWVVILVVVAFFALKALGIL